MSFPRETYEAMSDSSLIEMRRSWSMDLSIARKTGDQESIDFAQKRINIIEDILESRSKT